MSEHQISEQKPGTDWIVAGGEMGQLIRSMDWSRTPLGARESWPQSLRTTVNICLASDLPICIIWGPGLVQIYNDGYRVICGNKHPRSMGQNFPECWRDAWPVIGAAHDSALAGNTAFLENQHIFLERHGYTEECFFTLSFSPIRDEAGRLAGLFHPVIEMTPKMMGDRRTRTLRDMATRTGRAKSIAEAFTLTTETLAGYELDLPFVLIYRLDEVKKVGRLVAATGLSAGMTAAPELVDLAAPGNSSWPLAEVSLAGAAVQVDDVEQRFGEICSGPFPEFIKAAVLLPILPPGADRPIAIVVAGISPRLKVDEMYRGFHDLLASAVTNAVASARALEETRKRAEKLAEIDRAKTAFFSNVSHEFRTPLTLMLGPTEDLLALPADSLTPEVRGQLDLIHRNSLRLQKLVNTLLDFSRFEAGRIQASYAPTDLAVLTGDLASVFRSAIEKAGLKLIVDCPPLAEPVHVDRDLWEKIVLNLLSNAFKFTFAGEIQITQKDIGHAVQLSVRDTGTGIAAAELPRIFERFHRVEGAQSRSSEGTGIGLALVQGLVKLHGGTVALESVLGKGSTFTVTLPKGTAHLPADHIEVDSALASTALTANHYVEEAMRWLPDESAGVAPETSFTSGAPQDGAPETRALPRILLADDNADMRDYVRRLLSEHYIVQAVADGEAALIAALENPPDLILSDVMMPRLDGHGLLRELRADPRTSSIPVVLLSARAGEESRVAGMDSGADDYMVKPFSARELLARVGAHLNLAKFRSQAYAEMRKSGEQRTAMNEALLIAGLRQHELTEEAVRLNAQLQAEIIGRKQGDEARAILAAIVESSEDAIISKDLNGTIATWNRGAERLFGYSAEEAIGQPNTMLFPPDKHDEEADILAGVRSGQPVKPYETVRRRKDGTLVDVSLSVSPILDARGEIVGASKIVRDITERMQSETNLRASEERMRMATEATAVGIWERNVHTQALRWDAQMFRIYGIAPTADGLVPYSDWSGAVLPEDLPENERILQDTVRTCGHGRREFRIRRRDDGEVRDIEAVETVRTNEHGQAEWVLGTNLDITERNAAKEALRRTAEELACSARAKDNFLATLSHELRTPLTPVLMTATALASDPTLPAEAREQLDMMRRNIELEARLIDDLLDLTRIIHGKLIIAPVTVDIHELLDHTDEIIRSDGLGKQLRIMLKLDAARHHALADPARLQQVFWNLLRNAVKFTPDGGTITVSSHNDAAGRIIISVADDGIGIRAEVLAQIFDAFEQADATGEHCYGGLGLGLAISSAIVTAHGGEIKAESQGRGRGAEFTVTLGSVPAPAATSPQNATPAQPARALALLVVEDHEATRTVLEHLLTRSGHRVITAATVHDALTAYKAAHFDAVISDLGLPDGSGIELMVQIQSIRPVPGIALSGYGMEDDLQRSKEAGYFAHLVKPVKLDQLKHLLTQIPDHVGHRDNA